MSSMQEYERITQLSMEVETGLNYLLTSIAGRALTQPEVQMIGSILESWEDYIDRKHANEWHRSGE